MSFLNYLSRNILSYYNVLLKAFFLSLLFYVFLALVPIFFLISKGLQGETLNALPWAIVMIAATIVSIYTRAQFKKQLFHFGKVCEIKLRETLFKKYFIGFSKNRKEGETTDFVNSLTLDLSYYKDFLSFGLLYIIQFITALIPIFAVLVYLHLKLALLSFIPVIIIPFVLISLSHKMLKQSSHVQYSRDQLSTQLKTTLEELKEIQASESSQERLDELTKHDRKLKEAKSDKGIYEGLFFPSLTLFTKLITIALLFYQGQLLITGSAALDKASFVGFMWLQSLVFLPVVQLGLSFSSFQKGKASYMRFIELFNTQEKLCDIKPDPSQGICIDGNSYQKSGVYHLKKDELFQVMRGERVAGSFDISFEGINIKEINENACLESIGFVDRNPKFISGTVEENLFVFSGSISKITIKLLASSGLSLKDKVHNQGENLSGGQKRALAWARLFSHHYRYWILSEPTIHLDKELKAEFLDQTERFAHQQGVIVMLLSQGDGGCAF